MEMYITDAGRRDANLLIDFELMDRRTHETKPSGMHSRPYSRPPTPYISLSQNPPCQPYCVAITSVDGLYFDAGDRAAKTAVRATAKRTYEAKSHGKVFPSAIIARQTRARTCRCKNHRTYYC